jgi:hypothetical protein
MPTGDKILSHHHEPRNVERGPPCRGRLAAPSRPELHHGSAGLRGVPQGNQF